MQPKKTNTTFICILFALTLICLPSVAQTMLHMTPQGPPSKHQQSQRPNFQPQQYIADLEAYITKQADLTSKEAEIFFPLFHQLKKEQREALGRIKQCCERIEKEDLSESQCKQLLQEIERYQSQHEQLQINAFKEWRKVLSSKKIIKVINADQNFGRRMFKKMTKSDKKPRH